MSEGVSFAGKILQRAVALELGGRYTESLICYQEGLQVLVEALKQITNEGTKTAIRAKVEDYMKNAEKLKQKIDKLKSQGSYREHVDIAENAVGFSYDSMFGRFLSNEVTSIQVDDPYIRAVHQTENLLRFVELVVKKCTSVKFIYLNTTKDDKDASGQQNRLDTIAKSLQGRGISLIVKYSDTLHDREIRLDNGWVIQIGRGLDLYQPVPKFTIGSCDFDLRPCKETKVDIYHRKELVIKR